MYSPAASEIIAIRRAADVPEPAAASSMLTPRAMVSGRGRRRSASPYVRYTTSPSPDPPGEGDAPPPPACGLAPPGAGPRAARAPSFAAGLAPRAPAAPSPRAGTRPPCARRPGPVSLAAAGPLARIGAPPRAGPATCRVAEPEPGRPEAPEAEPPDPASDPGRADTPRSGPAGREPDPGRADAPRSGPAPEPRRPDTLEPGSTDPEPLGRLNAPRSVRTGSCARERPARRPVPAGRRGPLAGGRARVSPRLLAAAR